MRHVLKKLIPDCIDGTGFAGVLNGRLRFESFDRRGYATRIRAGATVVRVTNRSDRTVEVVYVKDGRRYRTTAGGVVMANGAWSSQYVVADVPDGYREAFKDFVRAPMLVVNVALRRWRFMYDLGLTAASYRDQFGFSCNIRQSMIVGDYRPTLHPDKPTILTFYVPFERPGPSLKEQAAAARTELLVLLWAQRPAGGAGGAPPADRPDRVRQCGAQRAPELARRDGRREARGRTAVGVNAVRAAGRRA